MIARTADAYYDWIEATAKLIRGLDPGHLVSLGQEGTQATNGSEAMVLRAHRDVDYLTAHVWPLNWGWVDGGNLAGTRSEEHTSELQSLMRISYAVFCLKKKKEKKRINAERREMT